MKSIRVRIRGISPLLMHRMSDEMKEKFDKARSNQARERIEKENVELYLYRDEDGKIFIPSEWLVKSMAYVASNFQIKGKGKKTYKKLIGAGFIIIDPMKIPLKHNGMKVDTRYVIVQRSRIKRHRPRFDEWEAEFTVHYDENVITKEILEEILKQAGLFSGIGEYRPSCGGSFGRFEIIRFEPFK